MNKIDRYRKNKKDPALIITLFSCDGDKFLVANSST